MISIHSVIKEINQTILPNGKQKIFSLKAYYTSGAKKGTIYFKPKVQKHLTGKYRESKVFNEAKSALTAQKNMERAKLMLYDSITKNTFSVPYWAIVEFNNETVRHE